MLFRVGKDQTNVGRVLQEVYQALQEKGYDPVNQIVGYLISGDPTYITSHRNARGLMRSVERDEIIEELVKLYLKTVAP
ncbi:MAG: IreB family regulatory phosphoprotein [Limnochordia bacterium]